jgi:hypothetical protein
MNGNQLQTWTSSDRFAPIGGIVIGLGAGVGGMGALFDAQPKEKKADEFEQGLKK